MVQTETNGTVVQGVQQPFEVSIMTGIEHTEIQIGVKAYPNPTTDFLTLKMENLNDRNNFV